MDLRSLQFADAEKKKNAWAEFAVYIRGCWIQIRIFSDPKIWENTDPNPDQGD